MSIEKPLFPAPQALDEPAIEIEIEDPESVSINAGGIEIELEPENDYGGEIGRAHV